jgi:hypothetical protein
MQKIQLLTTEGFNLGQVNMAMLENNCRRVTEFELILLNTVVTYLCINFKLTTKILYAKQNNQSIIFRELFVKTLLTLTNLTEEQICILLYISRADLQHTKNQLLPSLRFNKNFSKEYSKLINHITTNDKLISGNIENNPNMVLTRRLHGLIQTINA